MLYTQTKHTQKPLHTQQTRDTESQKDSLTYYGKLVESIKGQIFDILVINKNTVELTWKVMSVGIDKDHQYCELESIWCELQSVHNETKETIRAIKFSLKEVSFYPEQNNYFVLSDEILLAKDFLENGWEYNFKWWSRKIILNIDDWLSLEERKKINELKSLWRLKDPFITKMQEKMQQHFTREKEKIQTHINAGKWANEITLF